MVFSRKLDNSLQVMLSISPTKFGHLFEEQNYAQNFIGRVLSRAKHLYHSVRGPSVAEEHALRVT
jgi:hypothetical protein